MAQNDKLHIGDNQNSQWWGAKQGLFINALANQYGQFTADATFQATINQNTTWSIESTFKNAFTFGNSFLDGVLDFTGFILYRGKTYYLTPNTIYNELWLSIGTQNNTGYRKLNLKRTITFDEITNNKKNFVVIFDSLAISLYTNRIFLPQNYESINGNILSTDNYYQNKNIIRINYHPVGNTNLFQTGVVRDLRIYTRVLDRKEVTDNYHAMEATNRNDLFCEWKMAQPSDFYVYDNKLYARNTGSSGNTNEDGTGYDMQLVGYLDNIPILNSIY